MTFAIQVDQISMKISLYPKYFLRRPFVHGSHRFFSEGYKLLYPEYSRHGMSPWQHYVIDGKRKGFDNGNHPPASVFFPEGYEAEYPDVAGSGMDAWHHYVLIGRKEGRDNGLHPSDSLFFADGYRDMYPDVAANGVDPWHHYLLNSKKEGRSRCSMEGSMSYEGRIKAIGSKGNILLVGHDASRSGAPVLTLNILKSLKDAYNVYAMCLGDGELLGDFINNSCCTFTVEPKYRFNPVFLGKFFERNLKKYSFSFVIVNSAAAASFLKVSFDNDIPSVLLVHEFSYYLQKNAYESILMADNIVFSAEIVRKSYLDQFGTLPYSTSIVPQGDPKVLTDISAIDRSEEVWKNLIKDRSKKYRIVAGLGVCEYRKGTDQFLLAASEILKKRDDVFFVWIGDATNVEPILQSVISYETDNFSLRNNFAFIPKLKGLNDVLPYLDLVLLTSRLDPLPNVIISSMRNGIPFVSFDRVSGICDMLKKHDLGDRCLSRYMDCYGMAEKASALLDDQELYSKVSSALLEVYNQEFSFDEYIKSLLAEVRTAEKNHAALLKQAAAAVHKKFLYMDTSSISGAKSGLQSVLNCRIKPYPGFLPVADSCARTVKDFSLIDNGGCNYESMNSLEMKSGSVTSSAAVHIHAYYMDELSAIISRIKLNKCCNNVTFLVSTTQKNLKSAEELLSESCLKCVVRAAENKGRDFGPFFTLFNDCISSFQIVGHLHTKKSIGIDRQTVETWKDSMLSNLLGYEDKNTSIGMLDRNLAYMDSHPDVGLLFPDDPNVCGWNLNRDAAEKLIRRIGLDIPGLTAVSQFIFPVGSMFLARYEAIRNLFSLTGDDFPPEPVPYDGTVLHAIERVLPFVCSANNFRNVCVFNKYHSRLKYDG